MSNPYIEIHRFAIRLRRARRNAGDLSLRELVRRMNGRASASTLHRAFEGMKLPAWPVVERLLIDGCGLTPDEVRTDWLPTWVAVKDLIDPLDDNEEESPAHVIAAVQTNDASD